MSTLARNNIVRQVGGEAKSLFEAAKNVLSASNSWNQGDMLAFDTTAKAIKAVTAVTDGANFLGLAPQTIVNGVVKSPYQGTAVDGSARIEDVKGPVYGVVGSMILKTGDAFNPGDLVYISAVDAQTVTSVAPSSPNNVAIGIYQGPLVSSASAGQLGDVLVGARYGVAGLLF